MDHPSLTDDSFPTRLQTPKGSASHLQPTTATLSKEPREYYRYPSLGAPCPSCSILFTAIFSRYRPQTTAFAHYFGNISSKSSMMMPSFPSAINSTYQWAPKSWSSDTPPSHPQPSFPYDIPIEKHAWVRIRDPNSDKRKLFTESKATMYWILESLLPLPSVIPLNRFCSLIFKQQPMHSGG